VLLAGLIAGGYARAPATLGGAGSELQTRELFAFVDFVRGGDEASISATFSDPQPTGMNTVSQSGVHWPACVLTVNQRANANPKTRGAPLSEFASPSHSMIRNATMEE
jgi:hypothetical protein